MQDQLFTQALTLVQNNQLQQAESLCKRGLQGNRQNVNMLGLLGVIQLKAGRLSEAENTLKNVINIEPRFAKPYEDLAVLHMQQQQPEKAAPLFKRATELEPRSGPAWFGLAHALKALGKMVEAQQALERSAQLSPAKQALQKAEKAWKQSDFSTARAVSNQILAREPNNIPALHMLAKIETEEGHIPETERLLKKVCELAPDSAKSMSDLARFYTVQHRHNEAVNYLQRSVDLDQTNSQAQLALANALLLLGLSERALQAYEAAAALTEAASSANAILGRAHALRALGRSDESVEIYRQCIKQDIRPAESYWCLSSLRTYAFADTDLKSMQQLRSVPECSTSDQVYLDFAIAKALDDKQQFDQAWRHYERANTARRSEVYYDGATVENDFNSIMSASVKRFTPQIENSTETAIPIFIVGMPRSGSTLLEQILVSHSQVEGTSELPYMLSLGKHLLTSADDRHPPPITRLSDQQIKEVGASYLQATLQHRPQGTPFFIDKMPDNFQMIGLIARVLPQAKIIDARRDPLDTCIGNYRQFYPQGKTFTYDLFELGEYYKQYKRIMEHWDVQLPGKVLRINYEELINNTENEISRLLSFCNLAWEEPCLNFHKTQRSINSASSEQVRQPLYNTAIGFWRHYENQLEELKDTFQES